MTFVAPAWLALLGLLPVVVLLHMYRRRRVTVGSLWVWKRFVPPKQAAVRSTRRPRVTLDLLLQLLVVLLLALAMAGPRIGPAEDPPSPLIVLLDASATMLSRDVAPSRDAAARDALIGLLADLSPARRVTVVRVDDEPDYLHALRPTDAPLADRIAAGTASHVDADWHGGARLAARAAEDDTPPRVVLFTSPERAPEATRIVREAMPESRRIEAATFGDTGAPNVAIAEAAARPRGDEPGRWTVDGRLATTGVEADEVRLVASFRPDGTDRFLSWATTDVPLARAGTSDFDLAVDLPGPGLLQLALAGNGDGYAGDDVVPLRMDELPEARVLRVGPDHAALDRALLALERVALYRSDSVPADADEYDLVILDGIDVEDVPATSTWWIGTAPGGTAVAAVDAPEPTRSLPRHPLLDGFDPGDVTVRSALDVDRLDAADVLLASDELPLLQARTTDRGVQVVTAFDPRDSSWPSHLSFPAFVSALVDAAAPERVLGEAPACTVGRPCPLPAEAFGGDWRVLDADGDVHAEPNGFVRLREDPFATHVWPTGTFARQFVPTAPGIYSLSHFEGDAGAPDLLVHAAPWPSGDTAEEADVPRWSGVARTDAASRSIGRWLALLAALVIALEALRAGFGSRSLLRAREGASRTSHARSVGAATALTLVAIAAGAAAWWGARGPGLEPRSAAALVTDAAEERREDVRADLLVDSGDDPADAIGLAIAALPEREQRVVRLDLAPGARLDPADFLRTISRFEAGGVRLEADADGGAAPGDAPAPASTSSARIDHVRLPPTVRAGDVVEVEVSVTAPDERHRLTAGFPGREATGRDLPMGTSIQTLDLRAPSDAGATDLDVRLEPAPASGSDAPGASLEEVLPVDVRPAARVLVLSEHVDAAAAFERTLDLQGLDVRTELPRRTPSSLEALSAYDVVVLLDVPAVALHTVHQELLEEWVQTRGGGLVIVGGDRSFGAGGYYRTPLEDLSPLSALTPDERPEATLVFVLDRSGSMQARVGPVTRLDVAREATVSAFDLLDADSLVGLVAFDTEADTVAPIAPLTERAALEDAIRTLRAGGGTSLYPALVQARDLLADVDSSTKHVIVLTDGLSQPGDFEGVLGDLRATGATISFIGIGDGADRAQLANLAATGGGSFHMTRDIQALPGIMAQEAMTLASDPVAQEPLEVRWTAGPPVFAHGLEGDPPPLAGYVRTTPKEEATVHLAGTDGETPVLASWRYGLGRVVAFASQAVGPWARPWLGSERMRPLWPQVARWTAGEVRRAGLHVRTDVDGTTIDVQVDAVDDELLPRERLPLVVRRMGPGGSEALRTWSLREVAPGRYARTITMPAGAPRDVALRVEVDSDDVPTWLAPTDRVVRVPSRFADATDSRGGAPTVGTMTRVVRDAAVAEEGRRPWETPWRVVWAPGESLWTLLALAAFVTALLLRYAGTGWRLPHPLRRRSRSGRPQRGSVKDPRSA